MNKLIMGFDFSQWVRAVIYLDNREVVATFARHPINL